MNDDEFAAGGFTAANAKTIHTPVINEAFLTMECTLKEIRFKECVEAKTWLMKPFVKSYLKKQQVQSVTDMRKILEENNL